MLSFILGSKIIQNPQQGCSFLLLVCKRLLKRVCCMLPDHLQIRLLQSLLRQALQHVPLELLFGIH